jgi:hypothetical protein
MLVYLPLIKEEADRAGKLSEFLPLNLRLAAPSLLFCTNSIRPYKEYTVSRKGMMKHAIAYIRMSTQKQGRSGLGIEAQRGSITWFAEAEGYTIKATPSLMRSSR